MICLFKSLHPYHLLVQQDKPLPDDPVVMVMPEEPVSEPAPLPDLLQKLCEGIRSGPAPQQLVLDAGGGAVGDDVVHPPSRPLQIDTGLPVFLRSGQFLLPPGAAVDPKGCVSGLEVPEHLVKQRVIRLQDAVLDIMAARSPHGEHALASKFEYLAPLQQEHRGPDAPDRSAVPPLQRIGIQGIIVLVIAGHEQGGERPSLQEVQPLPVLAVAIPHAAEVPADQHHVLLGQVLLFGEPLRKESPEVAVGVPCDIQCHDYPLLL